FLEKYDDCLSIYWLHPLDNKHSRAVNSATNVAWFDLLEDVLSGWCNHEFDNKVDSDDSDDEDPDSEFEPIRPENIYGMDESGLQGSHPHLPGHPAVKCRAGDGRRWKSERLEQSGFTTLQRVCDYWGSPDQQAEVREVSRDEQDRSSGNKTRSPANAV
ncbi:hypothetical protein B0H10DRAFT_1812745, partial [Mycena sp. CBHHK59/15]